MRNNILISTGFHVFIICVAVISFPFVAKKPLDLPPIISVELIQITDTTNIPFALMGHVTRGDIRIDDQSFGDVAEYKEIYNNTLEEKLK